MLKKKMLNHYGKLAAKVLLGLSRSFTVITGSLVAEAAEYNVNTNVTAAQANLASSLTNTNVMEALISKPMFANAVDARKNVNDLCQKLGIADSEKVYAAFLAQNKAMEQEAEQALSSYGTIPLFNTLNNVSAEEANELVFIPVMRKLNARNQNNIDPICYSPKQLSRLQNIKDGVPNQAYQAFRAQYIYMHNGKDPVALILSEEKVGLFHQKYGKLNKANALLVPFYFRAFETRSIQYDMDLFDDKAREVMQNPASAYGPFAYDRGTEQGKGYKLTLNQTKAVKYEYGLEALLELQKMKPHFFDAASTKYIAKTQAIYNQYFAQ